MRARNLLLIVALTVLLVSGVVPIAGAKPAQQTETLLGTDTVVLVNSASDHYLDFEQLVQPYLDHFGVPYTVLDVAAESVETDIDQYALIIIGHRRLDPGNSYLDTGEQTNITDAVITGTGLVNFDNDLSADDSTASYEFVNDIFGFGYAPSSSGSGVTFISDGSAGVRVNCWEDEHQDPVLVTTEDSGDLIEDDGEWTEFLYTSSRDYPSVLADHNEYEDYDLPLMRFYASDIPNGEYEVIANLYDNASMRYYYGFTAETALDEYVDTAGGAGGTQHQEYSLGTVSITDGSFDLYVQDADLLDGTYTFFGWAWIRLVPVDAPPPEMHYITERHEAFESISTGTMTLADVVLPEEVEAVAMTGSHPFLAVTTSGQGRAVQWGTYDWMSHAVKGPVYGLDDLVWRSIVWAARKPFVMQGLPPFLTMRVDDESGPFDWIHVANEFDIKPWAGLFYHNVDATEAADLSALVHAGQATASVHAKSSTFFYYDHGTGDFSDETIEANYAEATQWHEDHDIPIAKFVLPHYYEFGTNVFQGLSDWGVEFVGTMMDPGNGYGAPWIMNGPFRLYETGSSSSGRPVYYADFMSIPGHPEFEGEFFNCVTEVRDDAGYEWYPSSDVAGSIGRGTRQTKRALDGMALPTLFTHGYFLGDIGQENWRAILQGITDNLAEYDPMYVTLDHACQYVRAMHTSDITGGSYDTETRQLTTTLGGETDMPTMFYLFTERDGDIDDLLVDVPVFSGSTDVIYQIPGDLDYIVVSPDSPQVVTGAQQQFSAQGYDADGTPIPDLSFTWDVVNGGGTIDADGLFTAGTEPGLYADTVVASHDTVEGYATVEVVEPTLDHFVFEEIGSQPYAGIPFSITISARDVSGDLLTGYDGQAVLTDTTGTIDPGMTGSFVAGTWTGDVTIGEAADEVIITAQDGSASGSSDPFSVEEIPSFYEVTADSYVQTAGQPFTVTVSAYPGTTFYCADDDHQDPVLTTFTDPNLFDDEDGEWDEFLWVGNRDYAGVFAGIPEASDGSLDLMRFYAYVPDGTYRVIANLYHSRDWRYYWGYTSDQPRAYSIDVTSGPAGDFAEFELGTVTVTDSLFELYTDYAEDLGGTAFEYFGWGWIRLEPVRGDIQINCWEDAHQDPVLETTEDVADLSDVDGQWTEFLYTSSRDYPSVLADHNEYEDYGLPLMRFYASGIPNGEYEVIANLYDNAAMRYYYGFTADTALDEYVDTAGGAGGTEHREYSLGTVSIADGSFDLYVQDADLLDGTYTFFGWAWIRLVPTGLTMSSSSPTMMFDGDGDGTFGEPGDTFKALTDGSFDIAAMDTTASTGVSVVATDSLGQSGSADFDILPAPAVSIQLSPAEQTVLAGEVATYQTEAEDEFGNTWDATGEASYDIDPGAGGSWLSNGYTSEVAGDWTVTAEYGEATDTAVLHVDPAVALTITKTSLGGYAVVGEPLTYTLTVTNEGPATAETIVLTDSLPAGLVLDSATASQGSGCDGESTIVCDLGSLADGATAVVTLVATPTAPGLLLNTAGVEGADPFGNLVTASAQDETMAVSPGIEIVKMADPLVVSSGSPVTFTITITNSGDATLTSVEVLDPLVESCEASFESLAPGARVTYTCQDLEVTESYTNTATVQGIDVLGRLLTAADSAVVEVEYIMYLPFIANDWGAASDVAATVSFANDRPMMAYQPDWIP